MVNANFTGKVGILTMALFDRKSRLGATLAAAATAGLAAAPALAQSHDQAPAQMQQASVATQNLGPACEDAQLSSDASRSAFEYARDNDAFAVAVFCGTESRYTNDQIEQVLRTELRGVGVNDVRFFYEQNDVAVTTIEFAFAGDSEGPVTLGKSPPLARTSGEQFVFKKAQTPDFALRQ